MSIYSTRAVIQKYFVSMEYRWISKKNILSESPSLFFFIWYSIPYVTKRVLIGELPKRGMSRIYFSNTVKIINSLDNFRGTHLTCHKKYIHLREGQKKDCQLLLVPQKCFVLCLFFKVQSFYCTHSLFISHDQQTGIFLKVYQLFTSTLK